MPLFVTYLYHSVFAPLSCSFKIIVAAHCQLILFQLNVHTVDYLCSS